MSLYGFLNPSDPGGLSGKRKARIRNGGDKLRKIAWKTVHKPVPFLKPATTAICAELTCLGGQAGDGAEGLDTMYRTSRKTKWTVFKK